MNRPATGVEKPTKRRTRHGLTATLAKVKLRGLGAIDIRTVAARSLLDFRKQLIDALGLISPQRLVLVDIAVRTKALLDHVDEYLLSQESIVNRRSRSLVPIVRERQDLAVSLARVLGQLGLDRAEQPAPSLAEYLASPRSEPEPESDPENEPAEHEEKTEPEENT